MRLKAKKSAQGLPSPTFRKDHRVYPALLLLRKSRAGFTLIELLIVIAVSVFLVATLVTFNRSSSKNIILVNEQAKLIQAITTAKSFSIQTFLQEDSPLGEVKTCGYGIHFEGIGYILFRDTPSPDPMTSPCVDANNQYTGDKKFIGDPFEMIIDPDNPEQFMFPLDDKVELGNLPGGQGGFDIVFIPPEPRAFFFPGNPNEATITLKLLDGSSEASVKVTRFGQITTLQ